MSEVKTKVNDADVIAFINAIEDTQKKADSLVLLEMFARLTNEPAKMWGASIVGFGQYHYKSERSSQEADWMLVGFSPRKQSLSLYVLTGSDTEADLLQRLGKHKAGKGCLYINKLTDINSGVLEELISRSYTQMKRRNT